MLVQIDYSHARHRKENYLAVTQNCTMHVIASTVLYLDLISSTTFSHNPLKKSLLVSLMRSGNVNEITWNDNNLISIARFFSLLSSTFFFYLFFFNLAVIRYNYRKCLVSLLVIPSMDEFQAIKGLFVFAFDE